MFTATSLQKPVKNGGLQPFSSFRRTTDLSRNCTLTPFPPATFDESIRTFNEFERSSDAMRALALNYGEGGEIIFFAKDLIVSEQLLPLSNQLPSGLLEKVRALARKQKQMIEKQIIERDSK